MIPSWPCFYYFWKREYSYLKVSISHEDVCTECHTFHNQFKSSTALYDGHRVPSFLPSFSLANQQATENAPLPVAKLHGPKKPKIGKALNTGMITHYVLLLFYYYYYPEIHFLDDQRGDRLCFSHSKKCEIVVSKAWRCWRQRFCFVLRRDYCFFLFSTAA
jgi:hypothetical protein